MALLALVSASAALHAEGELRNWFDDPFVQLTAGAAGCPMPAGPFVDESARLAQSHRRAEKGTTAWLAHEAERPKAYAYDADIAAALVRAFGGASGLPGSSLWATVQGRIVYIEGCVAAPGDAVAIEARVRALPEVQQAIAIVRSDPAQPVPYRVMPLPRSP